MQARSGSGRRTALVVAVGTYRNDGLKRLNSPSADARALREVLSDPLIGGFDVTVAENEEHHAIQPRIEALCRGAAPEDLLLLHFSCHGLKDDHGELYFAAANTEPELLRSTAVSARFVRECIATTRARQVVLLLDCCYGGAFSGRGLHRSGDAVGAHEILRADVPDGRGTAVITASNAIEYAFEGTSLVEDHQVARTSVFTTAVVQGLRSGEADLDADGLVSLDDLYEYVHRQVKAVNPAQTPTRSFNLEGTVFVAKSTRSPLVGGPITVELAAALASADLYARRGAVAELRAQLAGDDLDVARAALDSLRRLVDHSRADVADGARAALGDPAIFPGLQSVDLGRMAADAEKTVVVELQGAPLSRQVSIVPTSARWVRANATGSSVALSLIRPPAGEQTVTVELETPLGIRRLRGSVRVTVPTAPRARAETTSTATDGPAATAARPSSPTPPTGSAPTPIAPSPASGRAEVRRAPATPPESGVPPVSRVPRRSLGNPPPLWREVDVTGPRPGRAGWMIAAVVVLVALVVGVLTATDELPGRSDTTSPVSGGGTLVVASDLPLQGTTSTASEAANSAITLYLQQQGNAVGGRSIAFRQYDNSTAQRGTWDDTTCTKNAADHAATTDEVAVIGTFYSGCARLQVPVLNQAPDGPLLMVSHANQYPGLTKPWDAGEPARFYPTGRRSFARVIAADDFQGETAAGYLAEELDVKSVYVLHDGDVYGQGVATSFRDAAKKRGLRVAGTHTYDTTADSYRTRFEDVKRSGADAVFVAGVYSENGDRLLKDKVAVLGSNDDVKLVTSDGFTGYPELEKLPEAEGMYSVFPGVTTQTLQTRGGAAATFLADYEAKYGAAPASSYALYAVAALQVVLAAIEESDGTRSGVVDAVFSADGITIPAEKSVLGKEIRIDPATGDVELREATVVRMQSGTAAEVATWDNA